jgi:hypothetical protein
MQLLYTTSLQNKCHSLPEKSSLLTYLCALIITIIRLIVKVIFMINLFGDMLLFFISLVKLQNV